MPRGTLFVCALSALAGIGVTSGCGDDDDDGVATIDAGTAGIDASSHPIDAAPPGLDAALDCRDDTQPSCQGVCALTEAMCIDNEWRCTGDGFEDVEQSCDGFDNDCDGTVDEDVCATCALSDRVNDNLGSMWDVDFDFQCGSYLTTLISGPDFTTVVPADDLAPVASFFGNENQNMGFALVDPDPANRRVITTYSCCETCGCMAQNGLTLLHTCQPTDPGCGCTGETNCPGYLDAPFLAAGTADTSLTFNGTTVSTPTGLAVGPGNAYYVGNFQPATCSDEAGCDACDPANPDVTCVPSRANCCDTSPLGRLARFTLPGDGVEPTWRIVATLDGEEIMGLAGGRDGSIMVGTYTSANAGNLYRYDPVTGAVTLVRAYDGAVFSITQDRRTGDWYLETRSSPKLHRLAEDGSAQSLPTGVPADPASEGILQYAPDGRLYRLIGNAGATSILDSYALD